MSYVPNRDITLRSTKEAELAKRASEWVKKGYQITRSGKSRECGAAGYAYTVYWAVLRRKESN